MILTAFRKPEWDWTTELTKAQSGGQNTMSQDDVIAAAAKATNNSEPLFSADWIAKATKIPGSASNSIYGGPAAFSPRTVPSNVAPAVQQQDYYPGSIPGFVVGCTTDILEECFQRFIFNSIFLIHNFYCFYDAIGAYSDFLLIYR
jgi:hypothetical protein